MKTDAKYLQVAQKLRERVRNGDYLVTEVPSSRKVAQAFGVSHIVARKAIEQLQAEGVLAHLPNGRLVAYNHRASGESERCSIALLHPAYSSDYFNRCREQIARVCEERGIFFRTAGYVHWDDPVIADTVQAFHGVFLIGASQNPPEDVVERMRGARLATLDLDLTQSGIPRIALFDARSVLPLVRHVAKQGYAALDCVNTQPLDVETERRIAAWQESCAALKIAGVLRNEPVCTYQSPVQRAYEVVRAAMKKGRAGRHAIFCTNEAIAFGVCRALRDAGVAVGREVGVCTVGDAGNARYYCPSLTCMEFPDVTAQLQCVSEWMIHSAARWEGELALFPQHDQIFAGESTSGA